MMDQKIVILGGEGDGVVVAETIKKINAFELVGFLNDNYQVTPTISKIPVLGSLNDWPLLPSNIYFIQALNTIHKARQRCELVHSLNIPSNRWINVIDPLSMVSTNTILGYGVYIGPHVTIQPNVKLGNHISIRAGANLGHDVEVKDFCYIGPNAVLCGRSALSTGTHIGPNACVIERISTGEHTILGACSALTKNSLPGQKLFGVPAREIR